MEKTPNSSAPTLKLVNGPAGRDEISFLTNLNKSGEKNDEMIVLNPVFEYVVA
jgi:hypothetical protein